METLICFALGIFGVVAHSLMKARDLMADAKTANINMSFKQYLSNDWIGIALSLIAVIAWVFLFSEIASHYPKIENYIRLSFFGVGLMGSYLIQKVSSRSKKIIRDTVDEKTDIADNK